MYLVYSRDITILVDDRQNECAVADRQTKTDRQTGSRQASRQAGSGSGLDRSRDSGRRAESIGDRLGGD